MIDPPRRVSAPTLIMSSVEQSLSEERQKISEYFPILKHLMFERVSQGEVSRLAYQQAKSSTLVAPNPGMVFVDANAPVQPNMAMPSYPQGIVPQGGHLNT